MSLDEYREKFDHAKRRKNTIKHEKLKQTPETRKKTKEAQKNGEKVGKDKNTIKTAKKDIRELVQREIEEFYSPEDEDKGNNLLDVPQKVVVDDESGDEEVADKVAQEINEQFKNFSSITESPNVPSTGDAYDVTKYNAGHVRYSPQAKFREKE